MGYKHDLEKLAPYSIESVKVFNNALKVNNYKGHASIIRRVSSAYCVTRKSVVYPTLSGSFNNPMSSALLMMDCRRPAAKTNKRRDRGSPYLTPLLQ
jgi:hypothetical protein